MTSLPSQLSTYTCRTPTTCGSPYVMQQAQTRALQRRPPPAAAALLLWVQMRLLPLATAALDS
eukprot:COSAG06_NODE_25475_length_624_cov_0.480447_1_plen_62_part_01